MVNIYNSTLGGNYARSGYIVLDPTTRKIKYFSKLYPAYGEEENERRHLKIAYPSIPNPSRNSFTFLRVPGKPFVFRLTDKLTGAQIEDLMSKLSEKLYAPYAAWSYEEVEDNPKSRKRKVADAELSEGKSQNKSQKRINS